jgi:hypothetical protein
MAAPGVEATRDQLLAGAALAGDEHWGVAVLEPREKLEHPLHRRARAEHVAGGRRGVRRGFKTREEPPKPLAFERALDEERERFGVEGLGDEVGRSRPKRMDRRADIPEAGHDGEGQAGPPLEELSAKFDAVLVAQASIDDRDVELASLGRAPGRFRCARDLDVVPAPRDR